VATEVLSRGALSAADDGDLATDCSAVDGRGGVRHHQQLPQVEVHPTAPLNRRSRAGGNPDALTVVLEAKRPRVCFPAFAGMTVVGDR